MAGIDAASAALWEGGKGAERHVARGGAPQAEGLLNIHVLHNPHALNRRCVGSSQFTAPRPTSLGSAPASLNKSYLTANRHASTSTCNELFKQLSLN